MAELTIIYLRPAGAGDAPFIKQSIRQARLNPQGLDWRRFTIAVDPAGQPIGCIQLKPHKDGGQELASLVVERQWRKQGVAKRLIEHIKARSGRPLWLMCSSHLIPFYQQFDFVEVKAPAGMPAYFRRMRRLMGLLMPFFAGNHYLAIMVWQ